MQQAALGTQEFPADDLSPLRNEIAKQSGTGSQSSRVKKRRGMRLFSSGLTDLGLGLGLAWLRRWRLNLWRTKCVQLASQQTFATCRSVRMNCSLTSDAIQNRGGRSKFKLRLDHITRLKG